MHRVIYHSDYQTAARTGGDGFAVLELLSGYFESVAAGTRVVVHPLSFVPGHVFNLNLVVVGHHPER